MRPDDWLKHPREWSVEQWDQVGYAILTMFGLYVFLSSIVAAMIMLYFAAAAALAWSSRDRTK